MELKDLLPAIDKAVDLVIEKRRQVRAAQIAADTELSEKNAALANATTKHDKILLNANIELESAITSARALQEELQLKTTGFLNNQGNVKVSN
jgi:hypothetical protein